MTFIEIACIIFGSALVAYHLVSFIYNKLSKTELDDHGHRVKK